MNLDYLTGGPWGLGTAGRMPLKRAKDRNRAYLEYHCEMPRLRAQCHHGRKNRLEHKFPVAPQGHYPQATAIY